MLWPRLSCIWSIILNMVNCRVWLSMVRVVFGFSLSVMVWESLPLRGLTRPEVHVYFFEPGACFFFARSSIWFKSRSYIVKEWVNEFSRRSAARIFLYTFFTLLYTSIYICTLFTIIMRLLWKYSVFRFLISTLSRFCIILWFAAAFF